MCIAACTREIIKSELRDVEKENMEDFMKIAPDSIAASTTFINWLKEKGFFRAPASAGHHGAEAGALYQHSKKVYEHLVKFTDAGIITWERNESPFIIGMFHDLCKIDTYKFNQDAKKWIHDDSDCIIPGHAEKSLIYLMQWMNLTEQEIACIRWHMGAFEKDTNLWNYYRNACIKDAAVLYTHTADMHASCIDGI